MIPELKRSVQLFIKDEDGSVNIPSVLKAAAILSAAALIACDRQITQSASNPAFHANNVEGITLENGAYVARHADHADHQNALQ